MRRPVSIAMVIFGFDAMVTGIWQLFPPFNGISSVQHIIPAFIFGLLVVIRVWLTRRAIIHYFEGLGWRWVPIALGMLSVLYTCIVLPLSLLRYD